MNNRIKSKKDDSKDTAFTALEGSKGGKKDWKKGIKCHNCGKTGHLKAECWAKGGGKEGQRPSKSDSKGSKGKKDNNGGGGAATAATEVEDGVWAVVDDEGSLNGWVEDDNDSVDLYLLQDGEEVFKEVENPPDVPHANKETANQL